MGEKFEVVISGISGRFPECDNVLTFKHKLYNKEEFITVDDRKWPVGYKYKLGEKRIPDATGKYTSIDKFDSMVFKLNNIFASSCDVINRKILEPSFEAIVDAGINPYSLDGQNVGVFMSSGINDIDNKSVNSNREVLALIGSNKTMLSNRVSFAFNLTGPSFTIYTDALGGMESLETGYKYVSDGFVDAAIVGVSSSIVEPKISLQFISLGLLSPDGLTRVFDKSANGYGRSEGTIVFYLQRAEDAKRNYGTVKLCDTYYYGLNPSTLLGCDEYYFKSSLEKIYQRYNDSEKYISDIVYVEMNAYGCQRLDAIESKVVSDIFLRNKNAPLLVGSVKSNVGHTEGASGFMSILKALIALDTGIIAPNKDLLHINDHIEELRKEELLVVTQPTKLPGNTIAVNTFGLCGTVNHAIVQQCTKEFITNFSDSKKNPKLLLICGRTETGLRKVIEEIEVQPYNANFVALTNDAFTQYMPLHIYRGFTILPKPFKANHAVEERGNRNRPVWFVFSGMGSQWNCMGEGLLDLPIFADTVAKCDKVLKPKGIDIYEILTNDDPIIFSNILNAFIGIITIQIGLVEILKVLGIEPDGIIGHSVGENACAYADGCLDLEQAILASWARGIASTETKTIKGMMAAIGKGYQEITPLLPQDVEVACHNSADSSTLTGPADQVNEFVSKLQKDGIFAKTVNVANIAYHSKHIAPAAPNLLSRLKKVIQNPRKRSSKWISTSIPESEWNTQLAKYCSAEYLTNNLLNKVLFEEGCRYIPADAIVIELAPHGLLQAILKRSLPYTCTNIPLTYRSKTKENLNFLLAAIGKLYIAGLEPNVNNLFTKPEYPVPRGTPSISPFCTWYHSENNTFPQHLKLEKDSALSNESILISIHEDSEYAYLRYHRINDKIVIPPSLFMYLTWWIYSYQRNETLGSSSIIFEDVKVHKLITVSLEYPRSVSVMIQCGTGNFEVLLENKENVDEVNVIISGQINVLHEDLKIISDTHLPLNDIDISQKKFYEVFKAAGYQLTDCFRSVQGLSTLSNTGYSGKIIWNYNWVVLLDSLMKFQMFSEIRTKTKLIYPSRIRRLTIQSSALSNMQNGDLIDCHIDLITKKLTGTGVEIFGLQYQALSRKFNNKSITSLKSLQFISHKNPGCRNIEEFITLCLQLAVESVSTMTKDEEARLHIILPKGKYSEVFNTIVKDDDFLKTRILFCTENDILLKKLLSSNICFMFVVNSLEEAVNINTNYALILAILPTIDKNISFYVQRPFVEITKQTFSDYTFCLMRKILFRNGQKPLILFDDKNWFSHQYVDEEIQNSKPVFIVRNNIESSDVSLMLLKHRKHSNIRYLFVIDDGIDVSEITEKFLEEQILQDLPVVIYQHKEWGSYRNLSNYRNIDENPDEIDISFINELRCKSIQVECIYLHKQNSSNNSYVSEVRHLKEYGVCYTGTLSSGEKKMGFATINESLLDIDSNLSWTIPSGWSSEEAMTIIYNYAQAYNIFSLYGGILGIKSVLINTGNEPLLEEAVISVSLHEGFEVYVTPANDREADNIKQKFPALKRERICIQDGCQYEATLMLQTKGKGVDVVINFLSGIEHITALLRCVSWFGFYFEVGENNFSDTNRLGLYSFLNSITFVAIPNNISSILKLDEEKKKELNKCLNHGLMNNVIIPPRKIQHDSEYKSRVSVSSRVIRYEPGSEEISYSVNRKLRYDENLSYIIIGKGKKDNSWLELIKIMITKGARKFIVALENFNLGPGVSNQINRLLSQRKATIVLTSSSKLENFQEAESLAVEANKIGPLEAIFFVSLTYAEGKIRSFDAAVSQNIYFVCLFSGGLRECELRRSKGAPAVFIHGENIENITTVFHQIENIITSVYNNENSCTFYEVVNKNIMSEKKEITSTLHSYLPKNINLLKVIGENVTDRLKFVEITSSGPRYSETRGVYPVFVLPVLHGILLEPLLRNLFYPVFCAMPVNSNMSEAELAKNLLEELNKIQATGPVTLISETWSLNVALKLKTLIAGTSRQIKLFILEGNPTEWRKRLEHLGPVNSVQFDINLIKEIFHFEPKIQTEYLFDSLASFEENVRQCTRKCLADNSCISHVTTVANIIRKQLMAASEFTLENKMLNDVVMFQQRMLNDTSIKLSVTSKVVVIDEQDYRFFLQDRKISRIINENAAFNWWNFPKH